MKEKFKTAAAALAEFNKTNYISDQDLETIQEVLSLFDCFCANNKELKLFYDWVNTNRSKLDSIKFFRSVPTKLRDT